MKILVINANTTASMTEKMAVAARQVARPGSEILAVTPADGPVSIEGYYDGAFSVPGILAEIKAHPQVHAVVIGCFDDTGLDAARCLSDVPVLGIGEAAFHAASFLANKFSVITTLSRSVPVIEQNLLKYGLASRCAKVRASEIPVLELEQNSPEVRQRIGAEIERAIVEDGAEAIVLGCAGMTDLTQALARDHHLPILDGVACAVALAESLAGLGLKTSHLGGYAKPGPKAYRGVFAPHAPTAK
jgi:allantoin racemase